MSANSGNKHHKKLKMKRGWHLQQDNDRRHTSKSTMDTIAPQEVQAEALLWLLQPSNLNITKNQWIDLKRAVHAGQIQESHRTEDFWSKELVKIPQTRIERFFTVYKKCLQAVNLTKGVLLLSTTHAECPNFALGLFFCYFSYFEPIKDGNNISVILLFYLSLYTYWK